MTEHSVPGRRRGSRLWSEWIRPLGTTALLVFGFRSAVADWNDVPTGSMKPTILEGDRVFVNRLAYDLKVPFTTRHLAEWGAPQRGEIVVFESPADRQRLVKRVVGVPGDTVEMRENRLFLNGTPVEYGPLEQAFVDGISPTERPVRDFAREDLGEHPHPVMSMRDRSARRSFAPVTLPPDRFFMMGDSRDNSHDSRFFGTVPRAAILGRATAVVASVDPARHYAPRWNRFFQRLP